MMPDFVDIHHHLAFGVDDGPKSAAAMHRMLDRAAREGMRAVIATPHATPGLRPFPMETYRRALANARDYCREKGYAVQVLEGCEIFYTEHACRMLQSGELPTLAGTDFVLVEFSPDVRYSELEAALLRLAGGGYRPVVAHAERYRCLTAWPPRAAALKRELDVFFQINCASVIAAKGLRRRRFVRWMLRNGAVDALATDAHNTSSRPVNMKKAWRTVRGLCGSRTARALTTARFMQVEFGNDEQRR